MELLALYEFYMNNKGNFEAAEKAMKLRLEHGDVVTKGDSHPMLIQDYLRLWFLDPDRLAMVSQGRFSIASNRERALLLPMIDDPYYTITHEQAIEALPTGQKIDGNVRATIHHLREKIEPNPNQPRHILTIRGIGYQLRHFIIDPTVKHLTK